MKVTHCDVCSQPIDADWPTFCPGDENAYRVTIHRNEINATGWHDLELCLACLRGLMKTLMDVEPE